MTSRGCLQETSRVSPNSFLLQETPPSPPWGEYPPGLTQPRVKPEPTHRSAARGIWADIGARPRRGEMCEGEDGGGSEWDARDPFWKCQQQHPLPTQGSGEASLEAASKELLTPTPGRT